MTTTSLYRCEECLVEFKGRRQADGRIVASDAPPSGPVETCTCSRCLDRRDDRP